MEMPAFAVLFCLADQPGEPAVVLGEQGSDRPELTVQLYRVLDQDWRRPPTRLRLLHYPRLTAS